MSIPRSNVRTVGLIAAALLVAAVILLGALIANVRVSTPDAREQQSERVREPDLLGVFEGQVPCGDCARITLRLVLYDDPATSSPTTFSLYRVHVGRSDDRLVTHGTWEIIEGTRTDPDAVVYRLDSGPEEFTRYLKVGNDILLVLDDTLNPRVGDAAHSFTLSRTR